MVEKSGASPPFLPDRSTRPLEHDAQARRQELFRLVVADPAPLAVLGPSQRGRDRQVDLGLAGLGDEVARDLAAGVGERVLVAVAEWKVEIGEPGLLRRLAPGRVRR